MSGLSTLQILLLAGVALLAVYGIQEYRVNAWKADAFEAEKNIAVVKGENKAFDNVLKTQNARVEELIRAASQRQAKAELAALKVEKATRLENIKIRQAGRGPEVMNAWFNSLPH